jgi:hypothetical protein
MHRNIWTKVVVRPAEVSELLYSAEFEPSNHGGPRLRAWRLPRFRMETMSRRSERPVMQGVYQLEQKLRTEKL